ncbi:guanine nucleotide-binding protein G(I)/G(S)/G(O) subunit gamma-12 isoform X1 [Zalophus californianus]|uniref:Guanine nucleotide-binding protein G(I)/G(S)/G(O) subunit gamma-12 isoform X1 n=1 Tax=Zalophus californianus TaxID=9704 RepID=A0A6J2EL12_ZALCA|nr:guanine nucleotide-binding protein G(I)/G(S)/G(O) subunit gamma-12 isoform X1 [Zalophus californianus]
MNLGKGKWGRPRRPDVCGALQLPTSPLWQAGHDTVRRPKPRTVRVPGPEGGPGPEEGVRGRRRPARRAVRPAYPERGGAGAGRSRRRGRSRLQEPLETESPAAAVVTGGAHRQIHSTTYNLKTVGHGKSYCFSFVLEHHFGVSSFSCLLWPQHCELGPLCQGSLLCHVQVSDRNNS